PPAAGDGKCRSQEGLTTLERKTGLLRSARSFAQCLRPGNQERLPQTCAPISPRSESGEQRSGRTIQRSCRSLLDFERLAEARKKDRGQPRARRVMDTVRFAFNRVSSVLPGRAGSVTARGRSSRIVARSVMAMAVSSGKKRSKSKYLPASTTVPSCGFRAR